MIRYAVCDDINALTELDKHISEKELLNSINLRRVLLSTENDRIIGFLRYGMFWDNIPFMNMLFIIDGERGKGRGSALCGFWENEMHTLGYKIVLTSTQADERGQFFYRKRGYKDCGSLILPREVTEIIMYKDLENV